MRKFSIGAGLAAVAIAAILSPQAVASGGAFAVDDAGVDEAYKCKTEAFFSIADNAQSDRLGVVAPACVLAVHGYRFEAAAAFLRGSAEGEHGNGFTIKAKTPLPLPGFDFSRNDRFGLALVWGGSFDMITGKTHAMFFNVPATLRLTEALVVSVNAGYHEDRTGNYNALTWGAGFQFNLKPVSLEKFTLIAETFSNHRDHAAAQAGLRFTPIEKLDIDLIYGYNLASERASWLTVGMNIRF